MTPVVDAAMRNQMPKPLKIPFDSACLAAVIAEVQPFVGGKIQRIIQADETSVTFSIYRGSEVHLMISWHPDFARAHLVSRRGPAPQSPPGFCQALRKHLDDGQIAFIRQRGQDRILEIGISAESGDYQLVAELMGKHSNTMLVGSDRRVIAAGKWVSKHQSKRPIRANQPYEAPPLPDRLSVLDVQEGDDLRDVEGISPFLRSLIEAGMSLSQVKNAFAQHHWGAFYSHQEGAYPLPIDLVSATAIPRESISQAIEQAFSQRIALAQISQARDALLSQLNRVSLARETALSSLDQAVEAADRAPQLQQTAELVLAYQGMVKPGDEELVAWDYQGQEVKIRLDPELTAVENANKWFEKARKAKNRAGEILDQRDRIASDLDRLRKVIADVELSQSPTEIAELRQFADQAKWLHHAATPKAKEDRPFEGHAIREMLSPAGYRVLYGTNATSNDFLVQKVAKGNDWWFHVRGQTSAHVVLQTSGHPEKVQIADLIFCAELAARNSVAKHSTYVPVDYTLKKYVRKPRGSAPGSVVYEREKTLHVDP